MHDNKSVCFVDEWKIYKVNETQTLEEEHSHQQNKVLYPRGGSMESRRANSAVHKFSCFNTASMYQTTATESHIIQRPQTDAPATLVVALFLPSENLGHLSAASDV